MSYFTMRTQNITQTILLLSAWPHLSLRADPIRKQSIFRNVLGVHSVKPQALNIGLNCGFKKTSTVEEHTLSGLRKKI